MKHYLQQLCRHLAMLVTIIVIGASTATARGLADGDGTEMQYWSLDGKTRYATEPTDNKTIVVYYTFDASSKTIKSAVVMNPQTQEDLAVVIPSSLDVRHIADKAFGFDDLVTSLELPGTLESIGSNAFELPSLKKLTFTGHLNTAINVADDAYADGTLLTDETSTVNFTVDGNMDSNYDPIDVSYSFCPAKKVLNVTGIENKGIGTELQILGSVKLSGQFSADDCRLNGKLRGTTFTDVTITDGLKNLGATGEEGEFANCTKLNTVTLPKTFDMGKNFNATASEKTFDGCTGLKTIKVFWNGVPYIADWSEQKEFNGTKMARLAIDKTRLNAEAIKDVELWYAVTFIPGWEGFYTDKTLPAGSFQDCTTIKNVTIHTAPGSYGDNIEKLGDDCFNGCTSLETVNVDEGKVQSGNPADVTIDYYGCEKIGNRCFKGCTSLGYVKVYTNGATYFQIGDECFSGCAKLGSVENVNGLTVDASYHRSRGKNSVKAVFGKNCFYGCQKLVRFNLISIANVMLSTGTFENSGVVNMNFKDYPLVENSGFDADAKGMVLPSRCFADCNALTDLNFAQAIKESQIASDAFDGGYQWKKVGFYYEYSSGSWASRLHCTFWNNPENGESTTRKGKYVEITGADADAEGLSLEIPEEIPFCKAAGMSSDVIVLYYNCFADVKFGSIVLPKVLDEKGDVKDNCFNLDGLNKIAFYSNGFRYEGTKKEGTEFAFTLTSHPKKTEGYDLDFNLEQKISNVHGYVNNINQYAFNNDTQLKNITFTSNFTDYPWQGDDAELFVGSAFNGCTGLKSVTMPQCKSYIGTDAFKGCTSLETAELSNVSYLSSNAFSGCSALKRVHLNDRLTGIYTNAFYGCNSLKSIVVPFANMNKNSLNVNAFKNCPNLKAVVVDATSLTSDQAEELSTFVNYNPSMPLYVTKDCYDKAFPKSAPANVKVYTDYRRMPRQYTDTDENKVVELKEGYGSVCLPGEISLADSYNLKAVYSLQTIEGRTDAYGLKAQAQADVKAGKPYVFARCNDDSSDPDNLVVFAVDNSKETVSAPVEDDMLVGTFEKIAAPTGCYILQSDNLLHPVRSSRNVGAYRAYLKNDSQSAAKVSLFVIGEDTPTGITSATDGGDNAIDPTQPVYNLNGQRVDAPQKGQIYLMKGKNGYVKVRR